MLLVLTYHRVSENKSGANGFFDVSCPELEAHLQFTRKTWRTSVDPSVLVNEGSTDSRDTGGFLITFDDGTSDHYFNAAPLLERNGVRGVFFVSTSLFGTNGYLTLSQCRELQSRGHAIESHAHEHKPLVGLAEDELRLQLAESRRILRENGLGQWDWLAVPGGYVDDSVTQMARAVGYRSLRTIKWGYNRVLEPFNVESFVVNRRNAGHWFRLVCHPGFESIKKAAYGIKEVVKNRAPDVYSSVRHQLPRREKEDAAGRLF